jgi:hypothetical protein
MVLVRLDVMCVEPSTILPALLAGIVVSLENGFPPFHVFGSAVLIALDKVVSAWFVAPVRDEVLYRPFGDTGPVAF